MALARWQGTIQNFQGNIVPGASVEVRQEETVGSPLATLFADRAGTVPLSNPVIADAEGFVAFHAAGGAYQFTASANNFQREWKFTPIGTAAEFDFDQLQALLVPAGMPYTWDADTTTTTDPGSGQIKGNSVSLGAITELAISDLNQFQTPQDVGAFIDTWDAPIGGRIVLVRSGAPENFAFYRISGATIDAAGFKRLTVAHIVSGGVLSANDLLSVLFVPAGAPGADGVDPGHPYTFDTNQAIGNPGEGNVRFNNANPAQITQIAISDTPVGGDPGVLSNALLGIALVDNPTKAILTFRDRDALGTFIHFYVLDAFPTLGHVVFDVEHVAGTALFANDANLSFHWSLHGNKGQDGSGAVNSVFGRVGAVIAQLGDYLASLISNDSNVEGATVADALNNLLTSQGPLTVQKRTADFTLSAADNANIIEVRSPEGTTVVVSLPSEADEAVPVGTYAAVWRKGLGDVEFSPLGNAQINESSASLKIAAINQAADVYNGDPDEWSVSGLVEEVPEIGGSIAFNGTDQFMSIPNFTQLIAEPDRKKNTLAFWLNLNSLGPTEQVDVFRFIIGDPFHFARLDGADNSIATFVNDGGVEKGQQTFDGLSTGAFIHILIRTDTSLDNFDGHFEIYVQGQLINDFEINFLGKNFNYSLWLEGGELQIGGNGTNGINGRIFDLICLEGEYLLPDQVNFNPANGGQHKDYVLSGTEGPHSFRLNPDDATQLATDRFGNLPDFTLNGTTPPSFDPNNKPPGA